MIFIKNILKKNKINKTKLKTLDLLLKNDNDINENEYYDIYSPFSEILLNYYDYPLKLDLHLIKKYNLLEDYISFLKNKKCTNLFIQIEKFKEAQILREIKLGFSKLRKLAKLLKQKININPFSHEDTEELTNVNFNNDDFLSEFFQNLILILI